METQKSSHSSPDSSSTHLIYEGKKSPISFAIEEGLPAYRGPYSFSRMESGSCGFAFKSKNIDRIKGTEHSRFGTNIGSHMHGVAELEVLLRTHYEPDRWIEAEEIVDKYIAKNPTAEEFRYQLESWTQGMRDHFQMDRNF